MPSNYIKEVITPGDTVQALSQKYLDDASRWVELVLLNKLDYPFIVDTIRDSSTPLNVLAVGDTILIPIQDGSDIEFSDVFQLRDDYERILGEDIAIFDSNTSIQLNEDFGGTFQADTNGDIKTVRGVQNLKQAIMLRFCVPYGSLLYHPTYGSKLNSLFGTAGTYGNSQKVKIEIQRIVLSDQRVKDINIDSFTITNGVAEVSMSITPIGIQDIINMNISLDKTGVIEWA